MSDFKKFLEGLSPEQQEKYAGITNATDFIMNELYEDEELLEEELNMVSGGFRSTFRCKCGADAVVANCKDGSARFVCPDCVSKGLKIPTCKCGMQMKFNPSHRMLICPKCDSDSLGVII